MIEARIMIVEDEQIVALDIESMLTGLGYVVCAQASTGLQAVEEAQKMKPDLVLMDIKLRGEMDGIQAAEQIKQQLDVPVVYVTAFTDKSTLQRAKITAPYGYITKPIDIKELWASIDVAIYKHQLDRQITERENRFRSLIENSPDGVIITNEEGAIVEWNQAAETLTGLSRNAVIGYYIWDIQSFLAVENRKNPAYTGYIQGKFQRLFQDKQADWLQQVRDWEIQRADGCRLDLQVVSFLMPTKRGVMFAAIIRDITAQKTAAEALSASQEQLQTLLSGMPVVLWAINREGDFTLSTGKSLQAIGLSDGQVVGQSIYELYKAYPQVLKDVRRVLEGETLTVVHWVEEIAFESRLSPTYDPQGELSGLIAVSVDRTERLRAEQQLQYLATHDYLTELPNRLLFQDRLVHALAVAKRQDAYIAVMYLDLDGFKFVNDSVGHEKGDQVLRQVAGRIKDGVRKSDTIARLGGDEFGVVLEGLTGEMDAAAVAQKIVDSLTCPFIVGEKHFKIGISIGIFVCRGGFLNPKEMMRRADEAMYQVKHNAKGSYAFYSPPG